MKLGRDKSSIESNSKWAIISNRPINATDWISFDFPHRQWPQYVRERIHSTFAYVGGSLTITAISAAVVFNSPGLLHLTCQNGFGSFILFASLILGTGIAAHSIPYEEGFGAKQIAWASHCAAMVSHNGSESIDFVIMEFYCYVLGSRFSTDFIHRWTHFASSCSLHCWYRWRSVDCGRLRSERQNPVLEWSVGNGTGSGLCFFNWISDFARNDSNWCRLQFSVSVRWIVTLRWFPFVWHSTHYSQSQNTRNWCREEIRSHQWVSANGWLEDVRSEGRLELIFIYFVAAPSEFTQILWTFSFELLTYWPNVEEIGADEEVGIVRNSFKNLVFGYALKICKIKLILITRWNCLIHK